MYSDFTHLKSFPARTHVRRWSEYQSHDDDAVTRESNRDWGLNPFSPPPLSNTNCVQSNNSTKYYATAKDRALLSLYTGCLPAIDLFKAAFAFKDEI